MSSSCVSSSRCPWSAETTKRPMPALLRRWTARARFGITVAMACWATRPTPASPTASMSCERTSTRRAPFTCLARASGDMWRSCSSRSSTAPGTLAWRCFQRAGQSGSGVPSIAPQTPLPDCRTENDSEAPGRSAAMPTGVIVGSAPTAASSVRPTGLLQALRQLLRHLVAEGVHDEEGDRLLGRLHPRVEHLGLVELPAGVPLGADEGGGEPLVQRPHPLRVVLPHPGDRAGGHRLLVHGAEEGAEAPIEPVHDVPAVLGDVALDPRCGRLALESADLLSAGMDPLPEDGGLLERAPLGEPPRIGAHPVAVLPAAGQAKGSFVLAGGQEPGRLFQEPALLEPEGVDGAEPARGRSSVRPARGRTRPRRPARRTPPDPTCRSSTAMARMRSRWSLCVGSGMRSRASGLASSRSMRNSLTST